MLLTVIIGYVLIVAAAAVFQRRLIYFPKRLSPSDAEQIAAQEGFSPWRSEAGAIIGWKLAADSSPTASVLVVHGNAGCALDRDYLVRPIHDAAAVDVYVLEYPGYGARGGSPGMKSWLAAGEEALAALPKCLPIYIVSESIGAGVAAHLAGKHPDQVAGLMMFVPFNNLASVAQRQMPILPAYFLLRDRFNPAESLGSYRGPVKIVLAELDEVIPAQFGRKLFEGYAGPKDLQVIPGARHNDVTAQSPEWWKETLTFLQRNASAR